MDPILTIFAAMLAASVVGAIVTHGLVRHYLSACVISALAVGLATFWGYAAFRVGAPHWSLLVVHILFAGIIAAGVGIPFNRRRTGRGLGDDRQPRR